MSRLTRARPATFATDSTTHLLFAHLRYSYGQ
jgi:hypothetical protein